MFTWFKAIASGRTFDEQARHDRDEKECLPRAVERVARALEAELDDHVRTFNARGKSRK